MDAEPIDHLHELEAAAARFAALSGEAGDQRVPACDGWTARDVVEHLGAVHRFAASIVLSGQRVKAPRPLVTEPIASWYTGTATALLAALRAVSPDEAVPNFSYLNETAAFWPRRQMHETIVHTVDLQQALGRPESEWTIPAVIAADGVDEVLQVYFPRLTAQGRRPDVRSSIRLRATDVGRSWVVAPAHDVPVLLHPSHDADAVVTGTAADLYLGLWHRIPRERLQFDGDDGVALLAGATTS
jgi:uncharacterized protein (TIGR03083 family)